MTAKEKWSVSDKFTKLLCRYLNNNLNGWKWMDIATLMLTHTESIIKLCVRQCLVECKRNPRKVDRLARELMKQYAEMSKAERAQYFAFKDDEDEPSSQEEESAKNRVRPR